MKIRKICLLLALIMIFSFSMISCFNNDPAETTKQDPSTTEEGTEKIINVYLIAGQSNAVGYGLDLGNRIAMSDQRFTKGFDNVLYYGVQERWGGFKTDIDFEPVKIGQGVDYNRCGAELGIADSIADDGEMNAIIKCAWGATYLYPDTENAMSLYRGTWTSPTYLKNHNIDTSKNPLIGNLFTLWEETIAHAINLLIEDGYTPVIKGVWWEQGEAEMMTSLEMANAYRELYKTLIYDTRDMLGRITGYDCSNVPFVCGLASLTPTPAYQGIVRTAMQTVALELNNVGTVDCAGLRQMENDLHLDAEGQKALGERFIDVLKKFEANDEPAFKEQLSIDNKMELLVDEQGFGFKANLTAFSSSDDYQYGFLVVPASELIKNEIKEDYITNLKNLYINYKDIPAELCKEKINDEYYDIYFIGKLTNVAYEDLNTEYSVIAYVKNSYGDYMYSAPSATCSVARLASEELYNDVDNADKIQKIINAAINFLNGVAYENRENEANFDFIVEDSVDLKFSQTANKYQLTVEKTVDVDCFIRYSSNDPKVVSVDRNGILTINDIGHANITVECAGKAKQISVNVEHLVVDGVTFDGDIADGEYVGDVILNANSTTVASVVGMIKNGNLYAAFNVEHREWAPISTNWWLNDNVEIRLNDDTAQIYVAFFEGVPEFAKCISHAVTKTTIHNNTLYTTIEICVENVDEVNKLMACASGTNFGWLPLVHNSYGTAGYVNQEGIKFAKPVDLHNGIVLDGKFDENVYTENVKNNIINANGNGAPIEIMGTLTDEGILFGVTINHKQSPFVPTINNGAWYTFMNIEFHFNGKSTENDQYMFFGANVAKVTGAAYMYCNTVDTGNGYVSTLEIFVSYEAIGLSPEVDSVAFTARGWFETGWCDLLNTSWAATHKVTVDGITKIN